MTPTPADRAASSSGEASLRAVLAEHRRLGFLGPIDLDAAIAHAAAITELLRPGAVVLDLGSGGGLPGLVLAVRRPDLRLVLLDIRQRRADVLRRAVGRLGLETRVAVRHEDVAVTVRGELAGHVDVVTARAFGPLPTTLSWAAQLVRPGGLVVVSLPPDTSLPPVDGSRDLRWQRAVGSWGAWQRNDASPETVPRETST